MRERVTDFGCIPPGTLLIWNPDSNTDHESGLLIRVVRVEWGGGYVNLHAQVVHGGKSSFVADLEVAENWNTNEHARWYFYENGIERAVKRLK